MPGPGPGLGPEPGPQNPITNCQSRSMFNVVVMGRQHSDDNMPQEWQEWQERQERQERQNVASKSFWASNCENSLAGWAARCSLFSMFVAARHGAMVPWCHRVAVAPGDRDATPTTSMPQIMVPQSHVANRAPLNSPGEICATRQVRHDVMCQQLNSQRIGKRETGTGNRESGIGKSLKENLQRKRTA